MPSAPDTRATADNRLAGLGSRVVAMPRRVARNTSVATRLSLVALLVSLTSLVITSAVGLQRGSELAGGVLDERLIAIGASRADEIERYVAGLRRTTVAQAVSPSTADAIGQFASAYRELESQVPSTDDQAAVEQFYADVVVAELERVRDRPVSAASLVPQSPAAVTLQAGYVVNGDEPGPTSDDDGSRWAEVHRKYHLPLEEFVIRTGVDDLLLIDPELNTIVYSTAKNIDLGTSLIGGPHSGSALAALVNSFDPNPEEGVAIISEITRYGAGGDAPSAFVVSPVLNDAGTLAGFVAVVVGAERISSITTNDGSWTEIGDTGETYIVAADGLMRSEARAFIEDERAFLESVAAAGTASEIEIDSMERRGTTVLAQRIDGVDVVSIRDDGPRVTTVRNYLGREVVSAQRPLDIDELDWVVVTELEQEEVVRPVANFIRNLLIAIAVFIVALTFLAVRWSDRLLQPLRTASSRLRRVRAGREPEPGGAPPAASSAAEFTRLAGDIDAMLATLAEHDANAQARAAERRSLLRRILPRQVVQRAEAGERDVLDHVANATVAVVIVRGLGAVMRTRGSDEVRRMLDDFVDEADVLAKRRHLERLRITGDAYVTACGIVRPHLDHAQRAVEFVLDVRDLLADLDGGAELLTMSAGVDSGPVTVGLTGGSRLVYNSWGPTVQTAAALARRAAPDEIVASSATRSLLPAVFQTDDQPGADGAAAIARPTVEETVQ